VSAVRRKYGHENAIVCTPLKEIKRDMAIMAIEPEEPPITAIASLLPSVLVKDVDQLVKSKLLICEARWRASKVATMAIKVLKPACLKIAIALEYKRWWKVGAIATDRGNKRKPLTATRLASAFNLASSEHLYIDYSLRLFKIALQEALFICVILVFRRNSIFLELLCELKKILAGVYIGIYREMVILLAHSIF
jgi:hypothetical protein